MLPALAAPLLALADWLQESPSGGVPVFFALLLSAATLPIPVLGIFSSLVFLAGFIFGLPMGFALVYSAAVGGAVISFALGRRLRKHWARVPRWALAVQEAVSDGGFVAILLVRLCPLPLAATSMLLGSMPHVSATNHATATALGLPRLAFNVFVGSEMKEALQVPPTNGLFLRVNAAVAMIIAIGYLGRRLLTERSKQNTELCRES